MAPIKQPFLVKLSLPGKLNEELSYVFSDTLLLDDEKNISLFGLFSIHSSKELYQQFIKDIVQNFLDFYTKSLKNTSLQPKDSNVNYNEFVFESAIRYTHDCFLNSQQEISEQKNDSFDVKKIHFILGALVDNQLYLSGAGPRMFAFYIHPVFTKQRGFSHYTSVPVVDGQQDYATHNRMFTYLVQGSVGIKGSSIALLNQALLDYIPLEQLKQILTNNPIEKISTYFHGLLGKIHTKNDFTALFINPSYMGPLEFSSTAAQQTASSLSMAGLNSTERGTEHVLSPTLKPLFVRILEQVYKVIYKGAKKLFEGGVYSRKKIPSLIRICKRFTHIGWVHLRSTIRTLTLFCIFVSRTILDSLRKGPSVFLKDCSEKIKKLPISFSHALSSFLNRIKSKGRETQKNATLFYEKRAQRIHGLPGGSKMILSLSILFLFLFIFSILTIQYQQHKQASNETYARSFSELERSYMSIQSKLLYSSESDLQLQFHELDTHIQTFKKEFLKRDEKFERLIDRVALLKTQLFHITPLDQLKSLGQLSQELQSNDSFLVPFENDLFIVSSKGITRYNPTEKKIMPFQTNPFDMTSGCIGTFQKDELFVCSQLKNSLDIISTKKPKNTHYSLQLNPLQKNITAASFFNNKMYFLDSESGNIFKYTKSNSSYVQGTPLLKKPSDQLKNSQGMAIDGVVYILTKNASIIKISRGSITSLPLPSLQPTLISIAKIITQENSPYLFLLDSHQKRILIIDKQTGQLKNQFVSPRFGNLQDIALKANGKELYALNDDQLISIEIK